MSSTLAAQTKINKDVPYGLTVAAAWSWRIVAIVIGLGVVWYLSGFVSLVIIPVIVAALLAVLLAPVYRLLLRADNAVSRLGGRAAAWGCIGAERAGVEEPPGVHAQLREIAEAHAAAARLEAPRAVEADLELRPRSVHHQRRQPAGPYAVSGWSAGGVIAYEMGPEVSLVSSAEETAAELLRTDRGLRWPAIVMEGPSVFRWAVWSMAKEAQRALDAAGVRELPAAAEIADMLGAWRAGGQAGPGATSWQAGPAVPVGRPGAPVPGQPEQPAPMGPPAAPPRP